MSDGELAAFLAGRPTGALCVVDDHGRLLALPARIIDADDGVVRAEVSAADISAALAGERQGCVVADVFETYEGIRGVIAQGLVVCDNTEAAVPVIALNMTRTTSFSFAERAQAVTG
jgi:hypothetical protein